MDVLKIWETEFPVSCVAGMEDLCSFPLAALGCVVVITIVVVITFVIVIMYQLHGLQVFGKC